MPWAFLIDVLIACLPMLNANRIHGTVVAVVVYLIVLGSLMVADNFAVRRKWSVLVRALLKIGIFVVIEGLVLLSGTEVCEIDGSNCRRVFF